MVKNLGKFYGLCSMLRRNPNINTVKEIRRFVCDEVLDLESSNPEDDYCKDNIFEIVLPLLAEIEIAEHSLIGNDIKFHLLSIVTKVIDKGFHHVNQIMPFKSILSVIIRQIYDYQKCQIIPQLPEELKLNSILCAERLFYQTNESVLQEFYVKDNLHLIINLVFVCQSLINTNTYRKIKIASIKCLIAIFQPGNTQLALPMQKQISNLLFIMLPKIFTTLRNVTFGDEKQGELLISLGVKSMACILTTIMKDSFEVRTNNMSSLSANDFKELLSSNEKRIESNDNIILGAISNKKIAATEFDQSIAQLKRTKEWLGAATRKMKQDLDKYFKLITSESEMVRYELTMFACRLLTECSENLTICLSNLLSIIISLSQDINKKIYEPCQNVLTEINCGKSLTKYQNIITVYEDIFMLQLIKLPRIILTQDSNDLKSELLLMNGLLKYMSVEQFQTLLSHQYISEKFIILLLLLIELEYSDDLLITEYSIRYLNDLPNQSSASSMYGNGNKPWRQFKYLKCDKLLEIFQKICQTITSQNISLNILINHLMDLFSCTTSETMYNECILLWIFLLNDSSSLDQIINIFEELLLDKHWILEINPSKQQLPPEKYGTTNYFESKVEGLYESAVSIRYTDIINPTIDLRDDSVSVKDAKFNVLHICTVLEAIGSLMKYLQDKKHSFLLRIFHRILEKSGSSNYVMHSAGLYALNEIKLAFNFNSISDLIHSNADYLTYFIKKTIKNDKSNKQALDMLIVILQYGSLDTLLYVDNMLDNLLAVNSYKTKNVLSILQIFQIILFKTSMWSNLTDNQENDNDDDTEANVNNNINTIDENTVYERFKEILSLQDDLLLLNEDPHSAEIDKDFETDLPDNEMCNDDEEVDEKKKEYPKYIFITKKILQATLIHISSKCRDEKILALNICKIGLTILQSYEDELLPMVHNIWYTFAETMKDADLSVLQESFTLLATICKYAKDFVCRRTVTDILPLITSLLKKMIEEGKASNRDQFYENSRQFKFQRKVLKTLPDILIMICIDNKNLDNIMNLVEQFLSDDQPTQLDQMVINFFTKISLYDPTSVYVKLMKYDRIKSYIFKN